MPSEQTFDLTDCSIVIPIHIDSKERLEHLEFQFSYFERHFTHFELIVIEVGQIPKIPSHPNVHFVEGEGFSSARISNIGASFVKRPYFCKLDVDALVHPKAIFDAFETLKKEEEIGLILPYNGTSFSIQNPLRQELIQSLDLSKLPENGDGMELKNNVSTGLIHHFKTAIFKKFGGYNEEFIGWGYEDDELIYRFTKLGAPPHHLKNYNAFHLDHPRLPGDPVQAFRNQFKSIVVKNMDPEDIFAYIQNWNRFA